MRSGPRGPAPCSALAVFRRRSVAGQRPSRAAEGDERRDRLQHLHPFGEGVDERIATVYSDPITAIVVRRGKKEYTVPVLRAKKTGDGWMFTVKLPSNNQTWHYDENSHKLHHSSGKRDNRIRFVGDLVDIEREERSAA